MTLKKSHGIAFFSIVALSALLIYHHFLPVRKNSSAYTIGIIQTASHPALDNAREGFTEDIKNKLGSSVQFIIKNGQGSVAELHAIAKSFHENNAIDGIFAIATPALQAIAPIEKEKPIFISAVTDPYALGLITPDRNICGSSDKISIKDQLELITQLFPNARTIGIIFNPGEVNSVGLVQEMKQALANLTISTVDIGITHEAEIPMALITAISKIDILWAPTDNTVASAIGFITQKMREGKKPFIVSDNLLVAQGALAAAGVDYIKSGQQAARCAISVLINHIKPAELEIVKPAIEHFVVNKILLDELGIAVPQTFIPKVTYIQ